MVTSGSLVRFSCSTSLIASALAVWPASSLAAEAQTTAPTLSSAAAPTAAAPRERPHAYEAPFSQFPSHAFRLAPRWHQKPELAVHFGVLQPLFFNGFNAALDLRWGPMVLSYSHGEGLDYSATPELGLTREEREAGMKLLSPWTTGGGVGVVLLDELYVLVDVKVHRYIASVDTDVAAYTTLSVGGELGYRFFVWRGFFVQPVVRYWPNVHTSLPNNRVNLGGTTFSAKNLGFFTNVMLGWAFDV